MRIRRHEHSMRRSVVLWPLLCVVLFPLCSSAQTDWRTVLELERGTRVRVGPQRIEGRLRNADEHHIVMWTHGHTVDILRSDIQRVERGQPLAKRKTLVGFLAGWAVGTFMWREAKAVAPVAGLGAASLG